MSVIKDGISGICRKRRPWSKGGVSKDEAGCYLRFRGTVTYRKLGLWGSPEAAVEYEKIRREWYAGLLTAEEPSEEGVTLAFLFDKFLKMAEKKYRQPEIYVFGLVIRATVELFPGKKVAEFSALNFRAVRQQLMEMGATKPQPWSRQYVNRIMAALRTIFRWGLSYDYTPVDVLTKIQSVPGLEVWECDDLEEREAVEDVPDWAVIRTLPFMSPVIADMVKLQRGACMRPGEVCDLRVGDIDRSGEVWLIRAKKHKTARYGTKRIVAFGLPEIEILRRRCENKGADQFVFSPREAQQERWTEMRAARKSKVQPSQVLRGEEAEADKLLRYSEKYDSHAYNRAIKYAQRKARKAGVKIPDWFPYQLRHASVTATSLEHGREAASLVAGHKSQKTTEIYEHKTETIAVRVAGERKRWWDEK